MLQRMLRLGLTTLLTLACCSWDRPASGSEPQWSGVHASPRPRIKLLERGTAPLAPLRWRALEGRPETAIVVVEDVSTPGTALGASARVTALAERVGGTGEAACRFVFDRLESTAGGQAAAAPNLVASWNGSAVHFTRDAKGLVKGVTRRDYPDSARTTIGALCDLQAPHLPGEAVGVGARWEFTVSRELTWDVEETTTCTLRARAGDRATIEVSLSRTAKPRQERGSSALFRRHLVSYTAAGKGTYELDLTGVLPLRATMVVSEEERTSRFRDTPGDLLSDLSLRRWGVSVVRHLEGQEAPR